MVNVTSGRGQKKLCFWTIWFGDLGKVGQKWVNFLQAFSGSFRAQEQKFGGPSSEHGKTPEGFG